MGFDLSEGVGWTALMTAYAHAQESRRADGSTKPESLNVYQTRSGG
jgi:hypothetical protein